MNINLSVGNTLYAAISFEKNREVSSLFIRSRSWLRVTIKETVFAGEFLENRDRLIKLHVELFHTDTACAVGPWLLRNLATETETIWPASLDFGSLIDISSRMQFFAHRQIAIFHCVVPLHTEVTLFKLLQIVYLPVSYPNIRTAMYKNSTLLLRCVN